MRPELVCPGPRPCKRRFRPYFPTGAQLAFVKPHGIFELDTEQRIPLKRRTGIPQPFLIGSQMAVHGSFLLLGQMVEAMGAPRGCCRISL